MTKSVKILTAVLGFFMLIPGLAKFTEPFKTFIYQHLLLTRFPFPDSMQYVVKFGEAAIGLALLFLAFRGNSLSDGGRRSLFNLSHLAVVVTMIVAIYTHMHPDVPAGILPMEFKPPYLPIFYLLLVGVNSYLFKRKN